MSDELKPCPECKAYTGHAIDCSLMTVEEKAAKMVQYYEAWRKKCSEEHENIIRMQKWAVLWQGKHAILRHENNKLRRALYRQEKIKKEKDANKPNR